MFGLFSKNWNPDGQHCYVTGGSTGLGLALAKLLTQKGAHVSIVARNRTNLDKALAQLETLRQTPSQKFFAYSYALDTARESAAALEAVCKPYNGEAPDAVFTCAGASKPMFFVEMSEEDMMKGMTNGYWVQAWTAWALTKKLVKQNKKGKLTLVSSTLGYMSLIGYASYSPAKHALRGLADTLHSEYLLYGIDIHIFFPPTMFTPGYEEENKHKPKITLKIEETDGGLTAEQAALALLRGVQRGETHITGDFITSLFRASTRGATPRSNWLLDSLYSSITLIATPIWRMSVDKLIKSHGPEHREYLDKKGFWRNEDGHECTL